MYGVGSGASGALSVPGKHSGVGEKLKSWESADLGGQDFGNAVSWPALPIRGTTQPHIHQIVQIQKHVKLPRTLKAYRCERKSTPKR